MESSCATVTCWKRDRFLIVVVVVVVHEYHSGKYIIITTTPKHPNSNPTRTIWFVCIHVLTQLILSWMMHCWKISIWSLFGSIGAEKVSWYISLSSLSLTCCRNAYINALFLWAIGEYLDITSPYGGIVPYLFLQSLQRTHVVIINVVRFPSHRNSMTFCSASLNRSK